MIEQKNDITKQVNEGTSINSAYDNQSVFRLVKTGGYTENKYQFVGFKFLAAFSSVVLSEILISNTLAKWIFNKVYDKRYVGSLLEPKPEDKRIWVNRQTKNLMKTTIRYNSIIFCSKVVLDEHYSDILKRNEAYYESNSFLHYKIGAMVGLIAYITAIPISEFYSIKAMNTFQSNAVAGFTQPKMNRLGQIWREFLSAQSLKRMINNFSFMSLAGMVTYRTIYFGGYENLQTKYDHPINQYLLAPIGCSTLSLVVSPIDQVKYLQMTSHKGKSFIEIFFEKGFNLWNLPEQKIYTSVLKQSFAMSTFVAGQNLCCYFINLKKSFELF